MNTLLDTIRYFFSITTELLVLFIGITAIVEFIMMHISEEKMQKYLSGKGFWSNIIAAGLGALTPFCAWFNYSNDCWVFKCQSAFWSHHVVFNFFASAKSHNYGYVGCSCWS
ncbi:MAG: uncharacterized protein PWR04_630 [Anaerophaga sp.]|nr:uncharacterized protein [Anaerophaga sp.]